MSETRHTIGLIGFGEAGGVLGAELAARDDCTLSAFDILFDDSERGPVLRDRAQQAGVTARDGLAGVLEGSDLVVSVVTAASALEVARDSAEHLRPGQVFLDLNSVAPATKRRAREFVEASGADYLDVAVMAPIPPSRLRVPLLLGGARADELVERLAVLGFNARAVADQVGVASAIKMCRSVMIKGLEALTLECLGTARHYGAEREVLDSLHASFPTMGWDGELADYLISRIAEHGTRRSAEMQEVARTVADAALSPRMSRATADTQGMLPEAMQRHDLSYDALQPFDWRCLIDALEEASALNS